MTRISFIMPSFNRAGYIAESIETVLAQMTPDDELLIVDDGSTDDTEQTIEAYKDRLRFVRQDNAGKSVALNRGLGMTDGEYVWVCDDDDLLLPGVVDRLIATIEQSDVDFVFGRYTRFRHEDGKRVEMGTGYWPDLSEGSVARQILEDAFVMHNASLVRRSAYDRAGPFDPAMLRSQDYEMFVRLALESSITYVDELIFDQRKHDGARGPAAIAHRADRSDSVWERYDRLIFNKVRENVPLAWFEGLFEGADAAVRSRAGLLQRGCIMARHGLWSEAAEDFALASHAASGSALTEIERQICRRAVAGKHGIAGLTRPEIARTMRGLRGTPTGRAIYRAIAGGLIWRLRDSERQTRKDALRYLAHPHGALAVLHSKIRPGGGESDLSEMKRPEPVSQEVVKRLRPQADSSHPGYCRQRDI